jgi:hypothetical protein
MSATGEFFHTDARSLALGNVCALSEELVNPANLSFSSGKAIGLSVFNRFEMSELNTASLYWKCPNPAVDFGTKLASFGYSDYRISQLQGHLAKKLSSAFSIGLQMNYFFQSSVLEEDNRHFLSSGLGLHYRINDRIDLAALGEDLLSTFDEKPWKIHAGISYRLTDEVIILFETVSGYDLPFAFSAGLEYAILQQVFLRSGYDSRGKTPSFGLAYQWSKWKVDLGFSIHNILGISSLIGVSYEL